MLVGGAEHPRATPQVKTLSQLASVSWRALTDDQRQPYQAATNAAKQAYREYQQAERDRLAAEQMVQKAAGHTEEGGGSPSFGSGGPAGGGVTASSRPSRLSARAAAAAAAAAAAGPVLDTPQLERGGRRAFTSPPTPRIGAPISTAPEQREALSVGPAPAPAPLRLPAAPRPSESGLAITPLLPGTPTSALVAGVTSPTAGSGGTIPIFRGRVLYTDSTPRTETEVSVGSRPFSAGSARGARGATAPSAPATTQTAPRLSLPTSLAPRGGHDEAGTPSTSVGPASALLRYLQTMETPQAAGDGRRAPLGPEDAAAADAAGSVDSAPEIGSERGPAAVDAPPLRPEEPGAAGQSFPPSPLQLLLAAHAHIAAVSAAASAPSPRAGGVTEVGFAPGEALSTLERQLSATGSRATESAVAPGAGVSEAAPGSGASEAAPGSGASAAAPEPGDAGAAPSGGRPGARSESPSPSSHHSPGHGDD
ncbi:hypothetical protein QBZ16_003853 [Prototheca wickerhamii]|uniref:Uncharacterized protein n=1 Tax=Prototheca wickerhamii TaxID=3111 RepID=A0AAD9MKE7_PROWI|nr:hypothetical protein QBZ16_003853 [Prototheca wickerhamii]